jgi:hypothetical protein
MPGRRFVANLGGFKFTRRGLKSVAFSFRFAPLRRMSGSTRGRAPSALTDKLLCFLRSFLAVRAMRAIASTILLAALTFGAPALSDSSAALNNLKSCRRECTRSCDQLANERDCIAACRTQCLAREYKKDSAPAVSYGDHDPLGPGDPNPLPNPLVRPPTIAHPTTHTGHARGRPKARIIDTRSAPLLHPGDEEAGYGLYTYVLLRGRTDRDSHFLKDIVATAPSAAGVAPPLRAQIDLMLIPANSCPAGTATSATNCAAPEPEIIPGNLKASYNFEESNAILEELCTNPPEQVVKFCREPFGEGPFLFTYALPVSKMNSIPPPFLIRTKRVSRTTSTLTRPSSRATTSPTIVDSKPCG